MTFAGAAFINQSQILQTVQGTAQTLTVLLVGIASTSLIVGGIGIVFGFYPARRAARLDPIVALRTE